MGNLEEAISCFFIVVQIILLMGNHYTVAVAYNLSVQVLPTIENV